MTAQSDIVITGADGGPLRKWRGLAGRALLPALACLGAALILLLLGSVVFRSLSLFQSVRGRAEIVELFGGADYYRMLLNTFYFAFIATMTALSFGVPIAWLTERTDLPGRSLIRVLMGAGVLIPGFFTAMGWIFFANPRIGMVNIWLRDTGLSINVQTLTGMGFVQGLALAALTFVVAAPSLLAVDPALEESAEVHGLRLLRRLRYVTLPLVAPALVASGLVTFMVALAVFDIPAVLGLSAKIVLYSTYIYNLVNPAEGAPLYELAAVSSLPMFLLAVGLSLAYYRVVRRSNHYQVVTGKAYRPRAAHLGAGASVCAWGLVAIYLILVFVLPLAMVGWSSLLPFFRPISPETLHFLSFNNYVGILTPALWSAGFNTLLFSLAAPTAATIISVALSWVVIRHPGMIGRSIEILSFLPLSIPSVIFGMGAITIALTIGSWLPIYGTLTLIVLVEAVIRISVATRITGSAMLQLHQELDEAGAVFGLSPATRFMRIAFPLLTPALVYCWLFLAVLAFRELTVPALLVSRNNVTISVFTWGLISTSAYGRASAVTILVLLAMFVLGMVMFATRQLASRERRVVSEP